MGIPTFSIRVTPTNVPLNGELIVDVIPSEPLRNFPEITVDMAELVSGPTYQTWGAYRAVFVVRGYVNGLVRVKGYSYSTEEEGASLLSGAFTLGAGVPAGVGGVGWSPPGVSLEFAPGMAASDVLAAFNFTVERGYEGPQVVCKWENPTNDPVLVLARSEFVWPEDDENFDITTGTSFFVPLIRGVNSFADVWCQDGVMYYYGLYRIVSGAVLECVGHGAIFPVDNRPSVELLPQIPVLDVVDTLPMAPVAGDRYLLGPNHASYPQIATYDGGSWVYEMPSRRWSVVSPLCTSIGANSFFATLAFPVTWCFREFNAYFQDLTGTPGMWCPFVDKERLDAYAFLDSYDRAQDAKSVLKSLTTQTLDELDFDERFNFETDPGVLQPAGKRFFKLFTLPLGTAKGLIDWQRNSLMQVITTDLRLVPKIGALIGYEHYESLPVSLQRFFTLNLSHFHPILGRWDEVWRAFRNWLGPGYNFNLKPFADNVAYMGEAEFAVVTPSPEETGTELDRGFYFTHTDPAEVCHFKGVEVFADINPFLVRPVRDPDLPPGMVFGPRQEFTKQGNFIVVASATQLTEPTIDQVGQLFLVPVGADPGWAHLERSVVFVVGVGVYFPLWPWDYEGVVAGDTGHLWVFRQIWIGTPSDPNTHGEWFELPGLEQFYALQWWLQYYGAPGTMPMAFRDRQFPAMDMLEDFRSWPNGPVTSVTSKHGWWSNAPGFSFPPLLPFDKAEVMGVHSIYGSVADFPVGTTPSFLQGLLAWTFAGYGHGRTTFSLEFTFPVGFPGPTMLAGIPPGELAIFAPFTILDRLGTSSPVEDGSCFLFVVAVPGSCLFVLMCGPFAGFSGPSTLIIPIGDLADGAAHVLSMTVDRDAREVSADIDGAYAVSNAFVPSGLTNSLTILTLGQKSAGAPVIADIPQWSFTNLRVSVT